MSNLIKDLNFTRTNIDINIPKSVDMPKPTDLASLNNDLGSKKEPEERPTPKQEMLSFLAKNQKYISNVQPSYYNTKQYEKYHSALFGNSEFKDPSYYDNEELFAQKQGFFGSLISGTIKMIPSFASSFVSTFNPVGYDNKLSNAMMDFSEKMENWFPNYYSQDERENPLAFRNIMSGNFIGDKLVKNLGFMGGAMGAAILQDAIIGAVTGGTGLAPALTLQTGRAANWLQKAFKAETIASKLVTTGKTGEFLTNTVLKGNKALEYFNAMSKGQKVLTGVKTTAFLAAASHGEAAIEALEGYRTIKNDLIKQHIAKFGETPNALELEEIEKLATESANIRYGLNFATIFLSDAIQFSSLFKPLAGYTVGNTLLEGIGGNAERLALNEAGQLARRELTRSQKVISGLTGELMRDNISEAAQEGLQYSFEKAADSYAKKKWNHEIRGGFGDYLKEQGEGLKRMVGDTEGQESMLLGFLTGFVAHGFKKGIESVKGIDKKVEERENLIIDEFNNIDFNKLFDVNAFNEMVARDSELFNGRTTQEIILHQMRDAIANNDTLAFKSLKHEQLFNAIRTTNALGKFDAFMEKLDTLKELPDEEFKDLFGVPKTESKTVDEYVDKLKDEANKIKELVDQIDSTMENPFDKNSMEFVAFNDMKDTMAFHLSYINNINNRVDAITDKLLTDNPSLTEDLIYNMADLENFQTKFLQPLNQERQELYESYKLMSEMKEGRDEVLYKETQDKLKTLDKHIDLLNNHLKDFSEAGEKELDKAQIGAYKNIVLEVLRYNHEKYTGQPFAFTQNQIEDTLHALIDFQKLKTTLGSIVDSSNKFQTPEGRQKFMNEHMKFLNVYSQGFLKSIKEANFENLKKYKEDHLSGIKNEISSNLSEIEKINEQLQSLNEQLKDVEDKTEIKKQIDELKEQKDKILKENQELEKVADALENDKELDEDTNLEKRKKEIEYSIDQLEKDIKDRKKELIKNGASEKDAEKIARKEFNESDGGKNKIALEKLYGELDKINNQLEQKDEDVEKEEKQTETSSKEVSVKNQDILPEEVKLKKEIDKLEKKVFLEKNNNKIISINGKKGLLKIINENRVELESDNKIYEFNINDINIYSEIQNPDPKYIISKITEDKVNVNNTEYQINIDDKGNIESISPLNNLEQKIKNDALIIAVEIERNKLEVNSQILPKSTISDLLKENNYENIDNLLNTIYNINFTDIVNSGLEKLYDSKPLNENEKLQVGLWLQDSFDRIVKLFNENNTEEENEILLNAHDNLDIILSLLYNKPLKETTKKIKNEIEENVRKTKVANSAKEAKKQTDKQTTKTKLEVELEEKKKQLENLKKEEIIQIDNLEIETTTPKKSIDLELESKEDGFISELDKQEFNGRVHFLRTTDVEIYDKPEKDGKGGRTRRFQLFLEQFLTSNGLSQVENLNNWLSNNNLKFVIMRPTDEMYDDRTFDEKYKTLDNQSKSAVLVLVDKDNKPVKLKDGKIDDSGDFVAEVLPTKKEKSKWNDQLQYIHDSEYKQLHNAVNSIKSSENPSPITVNITGVANGLYRFMTDVNGKVDKNPSPLTKSILDNPASELFVNTSSEDIKFGGFNLQRGKLYLKVSNEDKTYFYFPIQLGKISETKLGNSIHSILEYVFKNHKTLKEENDTLLKDIDLFLETVLYNGVKINNLGLEINFHLNSENPYFKIERVDKENKTQTLLYDLDSLTSDKKLFLNFLKGLDINSKTFDKSEQIEVPILDKNGLRIEKQPYKDFLLENTTPTIPFKIDLSKGFDRVKQALFFNIEDTQNSLLEDTQSGIKPDTGISELVQSEIDAKKADIERRRQEELNIFSVGNKINRYDSSGKFQDIVEVVENRPTQIRFKQDDGSFINKNKNQLNFDAKINTQASYRVLDFDEINAKYDAEYVDAVKKGEMTKEQAMQALEQAGRKGSDAYAELAALENSSNTITKIQKSQHEAINIIKKDNYENFIKLLDTKGIIEVINC